MFIMPSFKKSLIVEQFQGNYLNKKDIKVNTSPCGCFIALANSSPLKHPNSSLCTKTPAEKLEFKVLVFPDKTCAPNYGDCR